MNAEILSVVALVVAIGGVAYTVPFVWRVKRAEKAKQQGLPEPRWIPPMPNVNPPAPAERPPVPPGPFTRAMDELQRAAPDVQDGMRCCSSCSYIYNAWISRCPECGRKPR